MTIELTEKETNLLLKGLGELPAKESLDLIYKLQVTWNNQLNKPSEPEKKEKKESSH